MATFVNNVQKDLRVLTVSRSGSLLIPRDTDIPVTITPELRGHLDNWRVQWPEVPAAGSSIKEDDANKSEAAAPEHTAFKTKDEFLQHYDVIKVVTGAARHVVVANTKGQEFDPDSDNHSVWLENASASQACIVDKDTDLCGGGKASLLVEGTDRFDPMSACSVRWGFHRKASDCDKVINAEQAAVLYQKKGESALSLTTVAAALKDCGAFPSGSVFGYNTVVDSRKRTQLKSTAALSAPPPSHKQE